MNILCNEYTGKNTSHLITVNLFTLRIIAVTTYLTSQSSSTVTEMLYYIPSPNFIHSPRNERAIAIFHLHATLLICYLFKNILSLLRDLGMRERERGKKRFGFFSFFMYFLVAMLYVVIVIMDSKSRLFGHVF